MSEKLFKDGLLQEEIEEIKNAFKKYDINKTGKIDVKRFIKEMLSLGFDQKAPIIYKIFTDLDTEETVKKGGVTLDEVLNIMNQKIGNTKNEETNPDYHFGHTASAVTAVLCVSALYRHILPRRCLCAGCA